MLYPQREHHDASPKAISERTSYYQVRLAFHSFPQVIRECCTTHRFGPPSAFRRTSPCSWQAHLASGLIACYKRAIHTRFPFGSALAALASSMHKLVGSFFNRHAVTDLAYPLRLLVNIWFQVYFTRPHRASFHLSLTVLVHYRSLKVFSLTS